MTKRRLFQIALVVLVLAYPVLTSGSPVWQRLGALVLLGDPGRAYLPTSGLHALARYWVPTPLDLEDREARETIVWQLTG